MATDLSDDRPYTVTRSICLTLLCLLGLLCVMTLLSMPFAPGRIWLLWRFFVDVTALFFLAFIAYHVGCWRQVI